MGNGAIRETPAVEVMFHKAVQLEFKEGTSLEVAFEDGTVKEYDIAALFERHPQMRALENRALFCAGRLAGPYGIIWNEELDLEIETVYEDGKTVRSLSPAPHTMIGEAVSAARARVGWSQKRLARACGIDQSDISKIERGVANPSVTTLCRIAEALGCQLRVSIE